VPAVFQSQPFRCLRFASCTPGGIAAALLAAVLLCGGVERLRAAEDPPATDDPKIAAGETVYNTNCAICHGDDLVNVLGQAFDLRRLKADERPRFDNSVRNGKNNQMPPWRDVLSDEQIDQLWHYIRAHAYEK
jgi:mono/diheme cytochrome c family protein